MVDTASLQKYSLFGGLACEEIQRIEHLFSTDEFEPGMAILAEGAPNDRIHFILEGRVEIMKCSSVLAILGEGETFGEMEFLDVMPAAATVRALDRVKVARISNFALHEIFKTNATTFAIMMMNLARDLSRRLRRMDEIIASRI